MNLLLLYLLLSKAVVTSFSGMASLPIVRQDFVVTRHILTDRQLNTAIVYSTFLGGGGIDVGSGIAADVANAVWSAVELSLAK